MDSENVSISRFIIRNKTLYVKTSWKDKHQLFTIKIFDGDQSWTGRFSNEFAEKYREHVKESKTEYHQNVRTALAGKSDVFTYDFSGVPGDTVSATFSWKKLVSTAIIVHGSVPVHQDNNPESKEILIDFLLNENRVLRLTIDKYMRKNDELSLEFEKCKRDLEGFINVKSSLESSLYQKFVQLLTVKKRRILTLEQTLHTLEEPNLITCELD